jgi:hypothetical protein
MLLSFCQHIAFSVFFCRTAAITILAAAHFALCAAHFLPACCADRACCFLCWHISAWQASFRVSADDISVAPGINSLFRNRDA